MKPKSDTSEGRKQRSETAMDERLLKQLTEQLAKANLAAELELDAGDLPGNFLPLGTRDSGLGCC